MKKRSRKLMALAITAAMLFSACAGETAGEKETGTAETSPTPAQETVQEIKNLVIPRISEMETFNILNSQKEQDFQNLCNLVDPLLEVDTYGKLKPCIAEEWGTEDGGLTWKFQLRDGVKWVDMNAKEKADCTAEDFATSLEWVLNFHKNDSINTAMPIEMIKGAEEYYAYTKELPAEEAKALNAGEGSKFRETVGIEIPDAHTVIYHCVEEKPYFDSVATYACLYPMSSAMVDELGVDGVRGMNNETMWYNGCYTMTTYVQNNEKVFTKNPTYWDKECRLFDTVTVRMVESNDVAFQLYQSGEIDTVDLTESNLKTISENKDNKFHDYLVANPTTKYSYVAHFNWNKMQEDGTEDVNWNTAIANEAFRKAIYHGLDLTPYFSRVNAINPMSCENNCYTMKGLVYDSKGRDYVNLVEEALGLPEKNGETMVRLDKEKAQQYKEQAMEELSALGVTFPVGLDYYIKASSQTALDDANVFKQAFKESLGEDFISFNIKTYVTSSTQEVYEPHLHSMSMMGWGADYGDPQNYLGQETYGDDNAFQSTENSNINDVPETPATQELLKAYREYTDLVHKANAINDDLDARYKAFAEAEAYMIDHVLTLPTYYKAPWSLSKINPYSKMNAMFGSQNEKMKNWETNENGYTTAEIAAFRQEHEENSK